MESDLVKNGNQAVKKVIVGRWEKIKYYIHFQNDICVDCLKKFIGKVLKENKIFIIDDDAICRIVDIDIDHVLSAITAHNENNLLLLFKKNEFDMAIHMLLLFYVIEYKKEAFFNFNIHVNVENGGVSYINRTYNNREKDPIYLLIYGKK